MGISLQFFPLLRLKSPNPRKGIETSRGLGSCAHSLDRLKSPNPRKGIETHLGRYSGGNADFRLKSPNPRKGIETDFVVAAATRS